MQCAARAKSAHDARRALEKSALLDRSAVGHCVNDGEIGRGG
jgi:hypothetical protein